jgi:carboxymethylenebutenolidase
MRQDVINLYDQYVHGGISRREFLERLAQTVGGTTAALALLPTLENDYGQAPIAAADDKSLEIGRVGFDAAGTKMFGYLAREKGGKKRPAVIVIHENRGLNPHIEDVARRIAKEGLLAYAVDALSPLGGTPSNEEEAIKMIGTLKPAETVAHYAAAVKFLAAHAESTGKVGAVGFCWGGGIVNRLAAAGTSLAAGVAYYGAQIPAAEVPNISCPLLLHYASLDQRIDAGIPEFEAALKVNKKTYEIFMYEGANHAFNNNTNAARYDKAAADLAWGRTVAFLRKYLS